LSAVHAPFTAIVLAGQRTGGDSLAAAMGAPRKCLIPINGQPMLSHVVAALALAPSIGVIRVMTEAPEACRAVPAIAALEASGQLDFAACGDSPSATLGLALDAPGLAPPLLVTTADHALLTAPLVEKFCAAVRASPADILAAVAPLEIVQQAWPESRRTAWRFADGRYVGCNLFALNDARARRAVALWRAVEADRKRPWRIVRRFGAATLLRYVTGRLTLAAALARLSRLAGCQAAVVRLDDPEAAVDVDNVADYRLVARILAQRAAATPGASSGGQSATMA
jgi:GTP:adenosylcobinamide-phosphate guanylyltransferase